MRIDHRNSQHASSEVVTTNLVSLTFILSAVVFLGAVCRFFKRCFEKFTKKGKRHDDIAFTPIKQSSQVGRSYSSPRIFSEQYSIVHSEDVPVDTETTTVQPEVRSRQCEHFLRPRTPTDPGARPNMWRQHSAPMALTPPCLPRGMTSPMGLKKTKWSSHGDIKSSELDPGIYKREASLLKLCTSSKKKCGTLDTAILFNYKTRELKVAINSVQQLLKQHQNETNTYVSVKKLPEQKERRTSVHTKVVDPIYNDVFTFIVDPHDDVSSQVLVYGLNHVDRFSASYLRGEAYLPLFQIDLHIRQRVVIPIIEVKKPLFNAMHPLYGSNTTGCILVSLQYQPWKETIVVNPVSVRHIPRKRHANYGKYVYIKVHQSHRGNRLQKLKTRLVELERMPDDNDFYQVTFNEPLSIEIRSIPVEETEVNISLNHYLFLKSSFIIGQIRLSLNESSYEASHFQNMIDSPGDKIAMWYEMRGFPASPVLDDIS